MAEADTAPAVMVTVRPPGEMPPGPLSLKPVPYQRAVPHIKHAAGFAQDYYRRLAAAEGFDDALLAGPGGVISEGAIANVAFFDGTTLTDIPSFAAAVITNSRGIAAVGRIGASTLPGCPALMNAHGGIYESIPRDPI